MKIKVRYSKLGKSRSWGFAHYEDNSVELDLRLKGKKHLEVITHEVWHLLFPDMSEEDVIKNSVLLTNVLWQDGYRKVDNSNNEPMQDGTL